MKKEYIFTLCIISIFLLAGCAQQVPQKETCKSPYIEYKIGECCLDQNGNNICDNDEVEETGITFTYNEESYIVEGIDMPLDENEACKIISDIILSKIEQEGIYHYSCSIEGTSKEGNIWSVGYDCDDCPFPSGGSYKIDESSRKITLGPAIA